MIWYLSHRADPAARVFADRHYNRHTPESPQFVPPGRCLVLVSPGAFWVTSWPEASFVRHAWAGAWVCSAFRRESGPESSSMIVDALAATRWKWPDTPSIGAWKIRRLHDRSDIEPIRICMVTFVDTTKTRAKRDPGRCYRRAGFVEIGRTKQAGLVALGLPVDALPIASRPIHSQLDLFGAA